MIVRGAGLTLRLGTGERNSLGKLFDDGSSSRT